MNSRNKVELIHIQKIFETLDELTDEYVKELHIPVSGFDILKTESSSEDLKYYGIYVNGELIGYLNIVLMEDYIYANRVFITLNKRRYFKRCIEALDELAEAVNARGIILNPNEHTANLYKKHKIAKEI